MLYSEADQKIADAIYDAWRESAERAITGQIDCKWLAREIERRRREQLTASRGAWLA